MSRFIPIKIKRRVYCDPERGWLLEATVHRGKRTELRRYEANSEEQALEWMIESINAEKYMRARNARQAVRTRKSKQ